MNHRKRSQPTIPFKNAAKCLAAFSFLLLLLTGCDKKKDDVIEPNLTETSKKLRHGWKLTAIRHNDNEPFTVIPNDSTSDGRSEVWYGEDSIHTMSIHISSTLDTIHNRYGYELLSPTSYRTTQMDTSGNPFVNYTILELTDNNLTVKMTDFSSTYKYNRVD